MKGRGKFIAFAGMYSLLLCLYSGLDQSYQKVSEHPIFSTVLVASVLLLIIGIELCCLEK